MRQSLSGRFLSDKTRQMRREAYLEYLDAMPILIG
jgi:hypothetical protein